MMGMLPVGMSVYRESKDSSNENWIFQVLQAKVLATDWKTLMPSGIAGQNRYNGETYFYDEEGKFVEMTGAGSGNFKLPNADFSKLYMSKIINGQTLRPGDTTAMPNTNTFAVLLVNINNKAAVASFGNIITLNDLKTPVGGTSRVDRGVRVRTFLVAKMDSTN